EEAERLEKRIRNLLYLTKLDYLANHEITKEVFSLDSLAKDVVERLSWNRTDIDWNLNLSSIKINGDIEQWRVVLENLLDNQIRYANSEIIVTLTIESNSKAL